MISRCCWLHILVALLLLGHASGAESLPSLVSPDERLTVNVTMDDGRPYWQVDFEGQPLLQRGTLGIELSQHSFRFPLTVERVHTGEGDRTWRPLWGNLSEIRDRYNELTVTLCEANPDGRRFQTVLRAYDEGVACRYVVPAQRGLETVAIKRRMTEYSFGSNRPVYHNRNYEYGTVDIGTMTRSEGAVTVDVGGGRFVALTDADRSDFPLVAWERSKNRAGTLVGSLSTPDETRLPFHTSWEVAIVGRTAAKLYENRHIVENLCPPNSLADTSWIRIGEAICQVRNTRMVTSELKELMNFASKHGVEYLEIDHSWCGAETKWTPQEIAFFEQNKTPFWDHKPEWRQNVGGNPKAPARGWVPFRPKADTGGNYVDLDVASLAAYGTKLSPPVGVCLYLRGAVVAEFGGEHAANDIFAVYQKWGVAGIKLGFVPAGAQKHERAVVDVIRKAAAHHLIVNIHDGYYPSGLSRTFPNFMNVEGVAGEEAEHSIPIEMKSRHDVMLPFTRGLMGPIDYTPQIYKADSIKTHAHQVAMLGVYHGRPSIRGGMKQWSHGGVGGDEIEFLEKIPAIFDELRVVTDLGKYVTVARRRGESWYVASMGDAQAHVYDLPLDFLSEGRTYEASIYHDTPGKPQTTHARMAVSATSKVSIRMEPNGGHLMIIEPSPPRR